MLSASKMTTWTQSSHVQEVDISPAVGVRKGISTDLSKAMNFLAPMKAALFLSLCEYVKRMEDLLITMMRLLYATKKTKF